jgi:hypothetical protein
VKRLTQEKSANIRDYKHYKDVLLVLIIKIIKESQFTGDNTAAHSQDSEKRRDKV